MSTTIFDYMEKVKGVRDNIPNQTQRIVESKKEFIINLNTKAQLNQGIDANGDKILPEYKPFTVQIKQLIGQPYDRVTLFYSGKFYKGFNIHFDKTKMQIELFSSDSKSLGLMSKYGNDIFGLTEYNQTILNEIIIKPDLWSFIEDYL